MTTFHTERRYLHQSPEGIEDPEGMAIAPTVSFARSDAGDVAIMLSTQQGALVAQTILMPADVDDLASWLHEVRTDDEEPIEFRTSKAAGVAQIDLAMVVGLDYFEPAGVPGARVTRILLQGGHVVEVPDSIDNVRRTLHG